VYGVLPQLVLIYRYTFEPKYMVARSVKFPTPQRGECPRVVVQRGGVVAAHVLRPTPL
jgi:hypothetical protein